MNRREWNRGDGPRREQRTSPVFYLAQSIIKHSSALPSPSLSAANRPTQRSIRQVRSTRDACLRHIGGRDEVKIDVDGSQGEIAARKMVPQVHAGKISWPTAAQREPQGSGE